METFIVGQTSGPLGTSCTRKLLLAESLSHTFLLWKKVALSKFALSRYSPPLHIISFLSRFYPPILLQWDLKIWRFWLFFCNLWVISYFSLAANAIFGRIKWLHDFSWSHGWLWTWNYLYSIKQLIINLHKTISINQI